MEEKMASHQIENALTDAEVEVWTLSLLTDTIAAAYNGGHLDAVRSNVGACFESLKRYMVLMEKVKALIGDDNASDD